jgi:hypothetical protein
MKSSLHLVEWLLTAPLILLKRRNLRRAPLGIAPLVRDHLAPPVNIQGGNAFALNHNDTPTLMIKKPVEQK